MLRAQSTCSFLTRPSTSAPSKSNLIVLIITMAKSVSSTSVLPSENGTVEWVYMGDLDEPSVLEAYTGEREHDETHQLDDFFDSSQPVELVSSEPIDKDNDQPYSSQEYIGDDGIVDDRIPRETAFETFIGKNFQTQASYDFSSSLYTKEVHDSVSGQQPLQSKSSTILPGAESTQERLNRLTAEIQALSAETAASKQDPTEINNALLSELREQLRAIEDASNFVPPISYPMSLKNASSKGTDLLKRQSPAIEDVTLPGVEPSSSELRPEGVIPIELVAPAIDTLNMLERRVAMLERTVGVTDLEATFDGTTLATLTKDVRTRLAFVADEHLAAKLKEDARQIAHMLRNDMQSQRAKDALHIATILDKLQSFLPLLDSLPLLVDRLTTVRHLHVEASKFSSVLAALSTKLDRLESQRDANQELLETVRSSMALNIQTVNSNLDILRKHIDDVSNSQR